MKREKTLFQLKQDGFRKDSEGYLFKNIGEERIMYELNEENGLYRMRDKKCK